MANLPTGTVTLLFTDIEGSTQLWEAHATAMRSALARHDALLRHCIGDHDGHVFKTGGDAFCAAFHTAADALAVGLDAQRAGLRRTRSPRFTPIAMTSRTRPNGWSRLRRSAIPA